MTPLRLADFDYALPDDLIAQAPPAVRGGSRLLDVGTGTALTDQHVCDTARVRATRATWWCSTTRA